MKSLMQYFSNRPVVANTFMFGLMIVAFAFWSKIGKEELPEHQLNYLQASLSYPGASAEDVEVFVTKPIEEELKGITSLKSIETNSSFGSATVKVEFEPSVTNLSEKVQEIKDAIDSVDIPDDVENPSYRQFKNSEKTFINIGMYLKETPLLNTADRILLQKYVLATINKFLSLTEVSGVEDSGYLNPELQVKLLPEKLEQFELTLENIKSEISSQHVRQPVGNLEDRSESEVSVSSRLETVKALEDVIISSGFEGQQLRLSQIAEIKNGFANQTSVTKIMGNEGIILDLKKSTSVDIISAQRAVMKFVQEFNEVNSGSRVRMITMDDESYDIRNRLNLIVENGILGFILIALVLFVFLDIKSGLWVGMGIPFSLSVTLICALIAGYTINNMTLAAIIIVLGIVVDDAIIVAENIQRHKENGKPGSPLDSVGEVGAPVLASLLTTCAAFVPLWFFSGVFGLFVKVIPTIIFFMLFASLIESFLILPGHMIHALPFEKYWNKGEGKGLAKLRKRYTKKLETTYEKLCLKLLHYRGFVLLGFIAILLGGGVILKSKMKYVMFPREESRNFRIKIVANEGITRKQMAKKIQEVENIFLHDKRDIVLNIQSTIAQNRRGGEVRDNEASIRVEITAATEREETFKDLIAGWTKEFKKLKGFTEISVQKNRFGSNSGSPIAIEIQENSDEIRKEVVDDLKKGLSKINGLINIEVEKPVVKNEYHMQINREEAMRLGVSLDDIGSTLRTYIQGDTLYTINSGDEEVDMTLSIVDNQKDDINKLLRLTVRNENDYLVPISSLVRVEQRKKNSSIKRVSFKRATMIYADIDSKAQMTPLDAATKMEKQVFPNIYKKFPTTNLVFREEIENSRESEGDFSLAGILVVGLIYVLLIILFNSLVTPLIIGTILPFGIVGVIYTFYAHGLTQFGFFSVIGALGMLGVVINDSIVLIDKFEGFFDHENTEGYTKIDYIRKIAGLSTTRLRAIIITTLTTVAGLLPTAYGVGGYDSMLSEMMLAMAWGMMFGMFITLGLVPVIYSYYIQLKKKVRL